MKPALESFQDLHYLAEAFCLGSTGADEDFCTRSSHGSTLTTMRITGQIQKPKRQITLGEFSSALERIPDEEVYPLLVDSEPLVAVAPDSLNLVPAVDLADVYIKRPQVQEYNDYKEDDRVSVIPAMLLEEAAALHHISQHELHPNIVKFHGCRVRQARITGLVLDRYDENLEEFRKAREIVDKEMFLGGLKSAIYHLHSIGLAHNDINPANIMVNDRCEPVLVDFGSSHKIGSKLTSSRGTNGWTEDGDDYTLSKESHDVSALEKLRVWLSKPMATGD